MGWDRCIWRSARARDPVVSRSYVIKVDKTGRNRRFRIAAIKWHFMYGRRSRFAKSNLDAEEDRSEWKEKQWIVNEARKWKISFPLSRREGKIARVIPFPASVILFCLSPELRGRKGKRLRMNLFRARVKSFRIIRRFIQKKRTQRINE